jgi:hypothetical protein
MNSWQQFTSLQKRRQLQPEPPNVSSLPRTIGFHPDQPLGGSWSDQNQLLPKMSQQQKPPPKPSIGLEFNVMGLQPDNPFGYLNQQEQQYHQQRYKYYQSQMMQQPEEENAMTLKELKLIPLQPDRQL